MLLLLEHDGSGLPKTINGFGFIYPFYLFFFALINIQKITSDLDLMGFIFNLIPAILMPVLAFWYATLDRNKVNRELKIQLINGVLLLIFVSDLIECVTPFHLGISWYLVAFGVFSFRVAKRFSRK